jgi:hypothetical protein
MLDNFEERQKPLEKTGGGASIFFDKSRNIRFDDNA